MNNKTDALLITGANGFVGKNLCAQLQNEGYENLLKADVDTTDAELAAYCAKAKFVFHLAGVNRPKDATEFYAGNLGYTDSVLQHLRSAGGKTPVLLTSSAQAELDNDYGKSKKSAEDAVFKYEQETGTQCFIFRMPGVFGKWCRPNYNSVVATFCHNVAHGLPIEVRSREYALPLVYIDDVVHTFITAMQTGEVACTRSLPAYCLIHPVHETTLGFLADTIASFKESRTDLSVADMGDALTRKLYATYLSYLPRDAFAYALQSHCDNRGSFTEFLRTEDRGQVSINVSRPGIVKGNHWHNTKNEKFLVVKGTGVIRFRKIDEEKIITYRVNGSELTVVDIPTGYTHNIENTGTDDMVTVMWASEPFDPAHPDTYFMEG